MRRPSLALIEQDRSDQNGRSRPRWEDTDEIGAALDFAAEVAAAYRHEAKVADVRGVQTYMMWTALDCTADILTLFKVNTSVASAVITILFPTWAVCAMTAAKLLNIV